MLPIRLFLNQTPQNAVMANIIVPDDQKSSNATETGQWRTTQESVGLTTKGLQIFTLPTPKFSE